MSKTVFVRRNVNRNYTVVANEILSDERLSWKAGGLIVYLLHLPPNWNLNLSHLSTVRPDGSASTRAGLSELEKFGYLVIERERDASGRFRRVVWTVTDLPGSENPNVGFPQPVNRGEGLSSQGNPPLLNTEVKQILSLKTTTTITTEHADFLTPPCDEVLYYPNVDALTLSAAKTVMDGFQGAADRKQEVLDEVEGRRAAGTIQQGVIPFLEGVIKNLKIGKFTPHAGLSVKRTRETRLALEAERQKDPSDVGKKSRGALLPELRSQGLLQKKQ